MPTIVWACWHAAILLCFLVICPEPYMDEIFHVPQAQAYCLRRFGEWNDKITTFPGLYLFSTLIHALLRPFMGGMLCTPTFLRATSALAHIGGYALSLRVLSSLRPESGVDAHSNSLAYLQSLAAASFPPLLLVASMYYTDALALTTVLLVFDCCITAAVAPSVSSWAWTFVAACVCILARQTNAVWVLFAAGVSLLPHVDRYASAYMTPKPWLVALVDGFSYMFTHTPILAEEADLARAERRPDAGSTVPYALGHAMLCVLAGVLPPVAAFVGFVVYNGSVVVGDHGSHVPVFHFAQLAYAMAICGGYVILEEFGILLTCCCCCTARRDAAEFSTLVFLGRHFGRLRTSMRIASVVAWTCTCVVFAALLRMYTYAHPYLLADNRHYTFYLWNRLLGKYEHVRWLLAPVYVTAAVLACARMCRGYAHGYMSVYARIVICIAWLIATSMCVIPAYLLEPRYFIIPVVLWLLLSPPMSFGGHVTVVFVTLFSSILLWAVFFGVPFSAPDGTMGRFMF